jgi:CBS domain-containing protein
MFINFSSLLGEDVLDCDRKFIGKLHDISAKTGEVYPKSDEIIIISGILRKSYASVSFTDVSEMDGEIVLKLKSDEIKFNKTVREYEFLLRRDILDQQVVDTFNHKVIRVNDIHLLRIDHELMVAHVDIGLRGLIRRLGWEKALGFLARRDDIVSWKFIQPVGVNPASMTMKLSVSQKQLQNIPAADLGDIIFDLNMTQRMAMFRAMDIKTKAKIFENIEFEEQKAILKELDKKEAAAVVTNMSPDEATDFLGKLPRATVENILTLMESVRAKKLSTLLGYSGDSAGGLMTTEFVSLPEFMSIESAIEYVKNQTREFDTVPYIYAVDEKHKLQGVTTIRKLLFADPKDTVLKTVFPTTIYVHLHDSIKEVAFLMEKYKISAIPVVDENKILHGIITIDDILSQVVAIAWHKRSRKQKGI